MLKIMPLTNIWNAVLQCYKFNIKPYILKISKSGVELIYCYKNLETREGRCLNRSHAHCFYQLSQGMRSQECPQEVILDFH